MVRHLVAVCVVCLLCADHLPCQLHHINDAFTTSSNNELQSAIIKNNSTLDETNVDYAITTNLAILSTSSAPLTIVDKIAIGQDQQVQQDLPGKSHKIQSKRHAAHSYEHHDSNIIHQQFRPLLTKAYLEKIFEEYGQNGKHTLDAFEFQLLLKRLGLKQLLHDQSTNYDEFTAQNQTCYTEYDLVNLVKSGHNDQQHPHEHEQNHEHNHEHKQEQDQEHKLEHEHDHHHNRKKDHSEEHLHDHDTNTKETAAVLSSENNAQHHHNTNTNLSKHNYTLNKKDFMNLCPILLYHVGANVQAINENDSSQTAANCITQETIQSFVANAYNSTSINISESDVFYVWIYAFLAVFACSILGLVGVAILPLMESRFYKSILQFLVSLAVGTMTGDALLHLLPHSLAGHNENNMVLKGLACLGGIMFFYITEHGLTMISEWRKKREKKESTKQSRARVMRDPDSSLNNSVTGEKVCKSKYSSYPYCYDEIAMDTVEDVWLHLPNRTTDNNVAHVAGNNKTEIDVNETGAAQSLLCTSSQNTNNYSAMVETDKQCYPKNQQHIYNHNQHQCRNNRNKNIRPRHSQHSQQQLTQANQIQRLQHLPDSNAVAQTTDLDSNMIGDGTHHNPQSLSANSNGRDAALMNSNTVTVILREHESSHHGHSHKHGHVHSPPGTLSAVVWMIIMGDGLHNFTDGMAIGAAFAENLTGGFSTALAVFCHELPHELGDFAILLKAGMSVKTAVYYNLLTGVLSFIGMIFGIIFGQSHETAQWMFAIAAGLFIYIAMVDMMPEITAAHKSLEEFAMQILGMTTGVLTMLLIAIYEDDLINVFTMSGTKLGHHHSSNSITHHNHHH